LKYKGNCGCYGCNDPECYVCGELKKCPKCGYMEQQTPNLSKCSKCGLMIGSVSIKKDWNTPSGNMNMSSEFSEGDDTTRRKE